MRDDGAAPPIAWAVATRPRARDEATGDAAVVTLLPHGALVAAVDGLGHGAEAARAAELVASVVRRHAGEDITSLVHRCHDALAGTRGAVLALATLSAREGTLTWVGVGNVEGRVVGASGRTRQGCVLGSGSGVVGHHLPSVRTDAVSLLHGDVVVLATDGVDAGFADALDVSGPPHRIAERIIARHWRGRDDALVLVVRYLGRP